MKKSWGQLFFILKLTDLVVTFGVQVNQVLGPVSYLGFAVFEAGAKRYGQFLTSETCQLHVFFQVRTAFSPNHDSKPKKTCDVWLYTNVESVNNPNPTTKKQ